MLIIDSSVIGCGFVVIVGVVFSEDNFGYYGIINNKFCCIMVDDFII